MAAREAITIGFDVGSMGKDGVHVIARRREECPL